MAQAVKNPPAMQVGKIHWRREWPPTPVFFPGESHGQRSMAGYNPWGCKESNRTNIFTFSQSLFCHLSCQASLIRTLQNIAFLTFSLKKQAEVRQLAQCCCQAPHSPCHTLTAALQSALGSLLFRFLKSRLKKMNK